MKSFVMANLISGGGIVLENEAFWKKVDGDEIIVESISPSGSCFMQGHGGYFQFAVDDKIHVETGIGEQRAVKLAWPFALHRKKNRVQIRFHGKSGDTANVMIAYREGR